MSRSQYMVFMEDASGVAKGVLRVCGIFKRCAVQYYDFEDIKNKKLSSALPSAFSPDVR